MLVDCAEKSRQIPYRVMAVVRRWPIVVLLLVLVTGCRPTPSVDGTGNGVKKVGTPIRVVATVGMVADLVRQVGGSRIEMTQIMGAGVDPHLYKPTRDDVHTILQSDIAFYCGLMLEGKMADTLVKLARTKPIYAITEMIDEQTLLEPEDFAGHYDPHLWNDVSAWSQCLSVIAEALSKMDPTHADEYRENAARYRQELEALHRYGIKALGSVPEGSRILITSHDAFNYFGRAYGLEVQGVQGLSTESEAGLQRINELVDLLVEKKIAAVFIESSVARTNIDALIEGARARGHEVRVGGELFSDAMGEEGTYEGTYVGMLDHNITLVARGLGGEAPERGLHGKLKQVAP